jgi:hypothetical protein
LNRNPVGLFVLVPSLAPKTSARKFPNKTSLPTSTMFLMSIHGTAPVVTWLQLVFALTSEDAGQKAKTMPAPTPTQRKTPPPTDRKRSAKKFPAELRIVSQPSRNPLRAIRLPPAPGVQNPNDTVVDFGH